MNWKEVCESPELQNLPFKLELNKDGEVVMNAVQINHALFAGKVIHFLRFTCRMDTPCLNFQS